MTPPEPGPDCPRCPRLVQFRAANRSGYPDFYNAPVPAFGPASARLLVVGLAPGLKGANRTGRPFTGDYAGQVLYPALLAQGLAQGSFNGHAGDGLELVDTRVTNALRCVPPENKPTGAELAQCRGFLAAELAGLPNLAVILALGGVAHKAVLAALGERQNAVPFRHGAAHDVVGLRLTDSYHFSRYNMNTGRLTEAMVASVMAAVRAELDATR